MAQNKIKTESGRFSSNWSKNELLSFLGKLGQCDDERDSEFNNKEKQECEEPESLKRNFD